MQKIFLFNYLILILIIASCSNKGSKQTQVISPTPDQQYFFPVTEFFLGQLKEMDSLPVTPLKIIVSDGKRDSVWLSKKEMRIFTAPFLKPVIDSINMQSIFSEKSFMDQTINAVTLTYDPKSMIPDSIKLNHWDVYIDPQKNTVQRIYLVNEEVQNGVTITTQLTWKVGQWCSIRTIREQPKMPPEVHEEIMKWNFDD